MNGILANNLVDFQAMFDDHGKGETFADFTKP
jgi:hypothetical protein